MTALALLGCAYPLENMDDLTIERAVLPLRELRQPVVQIVGESNHQAYEGGHGFSVHHGGMLLCGLASWYTIKHHHSDLGRDMDKRSVERDKWRITGGTGEWMHE